MQVASKKVYWKNNSAPNTCAILSLKKIFYQNLTDTFFQISLKCIKLVIPKILFILVLCSFDVYFKITWPPPHPPTKLPSPPAKTFLKFYPPPSWRDGGCMPWNFRHVHTDLGCASVSKSSHSKENEQMHILYTSCCE